MKLPGCFESCFKAQTDTKTGHSCKDWCPKSDCKSNCCVFFFGKKVVKENNNNTIERNVFNEYLEKMQNE